MSDDRLLYTPAASPSARPSTSDDPPRFIDSPARQALTQDLVRFANGTLSGRSYLISGHRGAGKTSVSLLAAEMAARELQQAGIPKRPLLVLLHGPSLLDPANLTVSKPAADPDTTADRKPDLDPKQLTDVLVRVTTELYHAVAAEFVHRMHETVTGPDHTELAEQLRIDLHGAPRLSRVRDLFRRAGVLDSGVLFHTNEPSNIEARGTRELATLWSASRAYMRVTGKLTTQLSEKEGDTTERSAASTDPARFLAGSKDQHPLFAASLALLTGLGLTAAEHPLIGVAAGLFTGLFSLLTLDARTSRKLEMAYEASETYQPDTTAHSLVRLLPRVVRELRDIGLAPVFVVDELDKVQDLDVKLETLIAFLKSVVADETFFCFLTDRDYFADQQHRGRDGAYSKAYTLFAQREYIVYSPIAMRRFVAEVVTPPPLPPERARDAQEAAAVFAYSTVLRAYGHAFNLRRELSRATGGTERVLQPLHLLRADLGRRREAAVAMAMEQVLLRPDVQVRLTDAHLTQVLIDTLYLPVRSWFTGAATFQSDAGSIHKQLRDRARSSQWQLTRAELTFVHTALLHFLDLLSDVSRLQKTLGVSAPSAPDPHAVEGHEDAVAAQALAVATLSPLDALVPRFSGLVRRTKAAGPRPSDTWEWTVPASAYDDPSAAPPDEDPAAASPDAAPAPAEGAPPELEKTGAPPQPAPVPASALASAAPDRTPSAASALLATPGSPHHFVRVIGAADPDPIVVAWATSLGAALAAAGYGLLTNGAGASDDAARDAYIAAPGERARQILTTDVGHHRPKPRTPDEVVIPYDDLPRADTEEARELLGDAIVLLQAGKSAERYVELARTSGVPVLPVPHAGALPTTLHKDAPSRRAGPALDEPAWERLATATPEDPSPVLHALETVLRAGPFRPVAEPLDEVLDGLQAFDEAIRNLTDDHVQPTDLAERYGLLPAQPRWWEVRDAADRLAPNAPERRPGDEDLVRTWWNEVRQHADAISAALGAAKALADLKQDGERGAVKRTLDRLAQRWPPEAPGRYLGVQRTYHAWRLFEPPLALTRPAGSDALRQLCDGQVPFSKQEKSLATHLDEAWTRWRGRLFDQVERGTPLTPDVYDAIEHALGLPTADLPLRPEDSGGWSRVLFSCEPFKSRRPLPAWLRPIALHHLGLGFAALPDAIAQHDALVSTSAPASRGSLRDQLRRLREHLERVPLHETVICLFLASDLQPPPTFTRKRTPIVVAEAHLLAQLERLLGDPPDVPKLRPFYALGAASPVPTGITFAGAAPGVLRFQPGAQVSPDHLARAVKIDP